MVLRSSWRSARVTKWRLRESLGCGADRVVLGGVFQTLFVASGGFRIGDYDEFEAALRRVKSAKSEARASWGIEVADLCNWKIVAARVRQVVRRFIGVGVEWNFTLSLSPSYPLPQGRMLLASEHAAGGEQRDQDILISGRVLPKCRRVLPHNRGHLAVPRK